MANETYTFDASVIAEAVFSIDAAITAQGAKGPLVIQAFASAKSFEVWEDRRKAVIAALVAAGHTAGEEAAARMLQRVVQELGLKKPNSTKPEAAAKAAKREAAKTALAALVAKYDTPEAATKAAMASGEDLVRAKALMDHALTLQRQGEKTAKEAERKARKELIDQFKALIEGLDLSTARAALKAAVDKAATPKAAKRANRA